MPKQCIFVFDSLVKKMCLVRKKDTLIFRSEKKSRPPKETKLADINKTHIDISNIWAEV